VTTGTAQGRVRALELEIRQLVVEAVAVQLHDIGIAAFVIRVALFAFLFAQSLHTTVESLFLGQILVDVFVAIQAEAILIGLAEAFVATRALGFVLCMPGDNFARHNQRLDLRRLRVERQHQHQNSPNK